MPPEEAPAYITDLTSLEKSILVSCGFSWVGRKREESSDCLRRRAYQTAVREEEPLCKSF